MAEQNNSADGFSGALNSILSNPEMLSMIGSMAQKLKSDVPPATPDEPTVAPEEEVQERAEPAQALPDVVQALAPLLSSATGGKHSKKDEDRACLLRALKPYLSRDRGVAIDYIIKFSSISDLLKNLS